MQIFHSSQSEFVECVAADSPILRVSGTETEGWEEKSRPNNYFIRGLQLCTFHPGIEKSNVLGKCIQISQMNQLHTWST